LISQFLKVVGLLGAKRLKSKQCFAPTSADLSAALAIPVLEGGAKHGGHHIKRA